MMDGNSAFPLKVQVNPCKTNIETRHLIILRRGYFGAFVSTICMCMHNMPTLTKNNVQDNTLLILTKNKLQLAKTISYSALTSQSVIGRICMSRVVQQIMYCIGSKCRLCEPKQTNHRIPANWNFTLICLDLVYNLHFQPVQYMIWSTTSDIYISSPYNRSNGTVKLNRI